jgi:hypothetical protein
MPTLTTALMVTKPMIHAPSDPDTSISRAMILRSAEAPKTTMGIRLTKVNSQASCTPVAVRMILGSGRTIPSTMRKTCRAAAPVTSRPPPVASMRSPVPLPPMLWENMLHIRDATLFGHPLFGVETIFVAGLFRLVHGH